MDVRRGGRGDLDPRILKMSANKVVFYFPVGKKISPLLPPYKNFGKIL